MKYVCVKEFTIPKIDDDGFEIENMNMICPRGMMLEKSEEKWRLAGGPNSIRLENDKMWIEIEKERFEECFVPYSKALRCQECKHMKSDIPIGNKRSWNYCRHPDYDCIRGYFLENMLVGDIGFLGFGTPDLKRKRPPKWCPLLRVCDTEQECERCQ